MKLSRFTPVNVIPPIQKPIWNGGQRKIGIASFKLKGTHNQVEILATNASGERIYPLPFYVNGEEVQKKYPLVPIPKHPNIKVYEIPIDDLELIERV